jgi:hypothetical protein
MPTPPVPLRTLERTRALVDKIGRERAAVQLKVSETTIRRRLRDLEAREAGATAPPAANADDTRRVSLPQLPSADLPIGRVVDMLTEASTQRLAAADARRWIDVQVRHDGPWGVAWIGDPHVDDNGCHWPLLRRHIEIIKRTPGLYAVGMGDYNNNWVGRLSRLWAHQDTSAATAWRLVEWLIGELREKWLLLIKGNHNLWTGAGDPLDFMRTGDTLSADWSARLAFQMPGGVPPFRVVAAHDFPGHSMWNPLHSPQRKAKFSGAADLYIAGHRHEWALAHHEDAERQHTYWLARARGYKAIDSYAEVLGHESQRFGASIVSIVNPVASKSINRVVCFSDVEEGAEYLGFLRRRKA